MLDLCAGLHERLGYTLVAVRLVADVFGLACRVIDDPETGTPLVVPAGRKRAAQSGASPRRN